jgi:hypothetical protein
MGPMMRWIATTTLLALLLSSAQGGEPTVISLSCDGTLLQIVGVEPGKPEPTKIALVVNIAEGTVSEFDVIAPIDIADDVSIIFKGENGLYTVNGSINRVNGATWAHTVSWKEKDKDIRSSYDWDLVCKVTNRLF